MVVDQYLLFRQLNDGSTTAMGLQSCQRVSVGQRNEGDGQQKTPAHLQHSVCDLWTYGRSWRVVFKNVRLVWSGALFTRHLTSSCMLGDRMCSVLQLLSYIRRWVPHVVFLHTYTNTSTRDEQRLITFRSPTKRRPQHLMLRTHTTCQ